ncbi:MAG: 2OG-Fe(II) oxygenase [Sphingobacteriales bacterium]|nr:MAG: 2OG-Fe(II) oxygenase [Sphingobacteriales bacterium]
MKIDEMIDIGKLNQLAADNSHKYASGNPFPHIVLDNVFEPAALEEVLEEFPNGNREDWERFNNTNEKKLACRDENVFGDTTKTFIHALNSAPFLRVLEKLTGIANLIPDPALIGGGLHQILRGGMLRVHADFNVHPTTALDRRLNLLIYLNEDWNEEYGGHFELWNKSMTRSEVKILPLFNRMAIFSTTSDSYHGHPDPLTCPENRSRKSIALYYYTNGRPEAERQIGLEQHSTLFVSRNGKNEVQSENIQVMKMKGMLKKFMPPIFTDIIRKVRS